MAFSPQSQNNTTTRVILLLDLDSFYAQCECIRLGYDASTTALALLQWNSVLAVTYPARTQFGVARGDSWQVIKEKVMLRIRQQQQQQQPSSLSGEEGSAELNPGCDTCHAIHVPLLTTERVMTAATASRPPNSDSPHKESYSSVKDATILSLEEEYKSIFRLSATEQEACRRRELGVRRLSHEGKASIERYRIASARIFQAVHDFIAQDTTVQLERASIDEFFLDVTKAVQLHQNNQDSSPLWNQALVHSAKQLTKPSTQSVSTSRKRTRDPSLDILDDEFEDDGAGLAGAEDDLFWRGAAIALAIRRHVYDTLGFTLTAGIGNNKTVSKLTASYGKPNGQAITLPSQTLQLLQQTPIGKCRNLGGKLGQQVLDLLQKQIPDSASDTKNFTVAMIARHLPLPTLQRALGNETAQWVFDLSAYGVDREPVVPKQDPNSAGSASKTKSLTAVKSLPNSRTGATHTVTQAAPWIHLLATDLVTRVQRDANRNGRFPKTCTLHYTKPLPSTDGTVTTVTKSVRLPFPVAFQRQETVVVVEALCQSTADTLIQKEGPGLRLTRIGLAATDFAQQQNTRHSIDRYFSAVTTGDSSESKNPSDQGTQQEEMESLVSASPFSPTAKSPSVSVAKTDKKNSDDFTLARELQARYDRESSKATNKEDHLSQPAPGERENNATSSAVFSSGKACTRSDGSEDTLTCSAKVEKDMELALKLQAQYDREHRAWQRLDRPKNNNKKPKTIDSFFSLGKNR